MTQHAQVANVQPGGLVTVAFLKAQLDEGSDHLGIFTASRYSCPAPRSELHSRRYSRGDGRKAQTRNAGANPLYSVEASDSEETSEARLRAIPTRPRFPLRA